VSRFIKNLLEPYFSESDELLGVHSGVNNLLSDAAISPAISARPTIAPENRAPPERQASRVGFAERTK